MTNTRDPYADDDEETGPRVSWSDSQVRVAIWTGRLSKDEAAKLQGYDERLIEVILQYPRSPAEDAALKAAGMGGSGVGGSTTPGFGGMGQFSAGSGGGNIPSPPALAPGAGPNRQSRTVYNQASGRDEIQYSDDDWRSFQWSGVYPNKPPAPAAAPNRQSRSVWNPEAGREEYQYSDDDWRTWQWSGVYSDKPAEPKVPDRQSRSVWNPATKLVEIQYSDDDWRTFQWSGVNPNAPATPGTHAPAGYIDRDEAGFAYASDGMGGKVRSPENDAKPAGYTPPTFSGGVNGLDEKGLAAALKRAQDTGADVTKLGNGGWKVTDARGEVVMFEPDFKFSTGPNRLNSDLFYHATSGFEAPRVPSPARIPAAVGAPVGGGYTGGGNPGGQPAANQAIQDFLRARSSGGNGTSAPAAPMGGYVPPVAPTPQQAPPAQAPMPQGGEDKVWAPEYGGWMDRAMFDSIPANWANKPVAFRKGGTVSSGTQRNSAGRSEGRDRATASRREQKQKVELRTERKATREEGYANIDRESARTSAYNAGEANWQQASKAATGYSVPKLLPKPAPVVQRPVVPEVPMQPAAVNLGGPPEGYVKKYPGVHFTPPNTGEGAVGPAGRTYAQITGKDYFWDETQNMDLYNAERAWYREQDALRQSGSQGLPEGVTRTVAQIQGTPYQSDAEYAYYHANKPVRTQALGVQPPRAGDAGLVSSRGSTGSYWGDWGENNSYNGQSFGALGAKPYQGQSTFTPAVEQWRAKAEQHVKPEDVNKLLYVIQGESSGNPNAIGDGGKAKGLFQSHHIPTGASIDQQFADAARMIYRGAKSYAKGTGQAGLVLNQHAVIVTDDGTIVGEIGEDTPQEPMGQQERLDFQGNKLKITALHRPQTGYQPFFEAAAGGTVSTRDRLLARYKAAPVVAGVKPRDVAGPRQQNVTTPVIDPRRANQVSYIDANGVRHTTRSDLAPGGAGVNLAPGPLEQYRPPTYVPEQNYLNQQQADLQATQQELQRQIAAQNALMGQQRADAQQTQAEFTAMQAARNNTANIAAVGQGQRTRDIYDQRYAAGNLSAPEEVLRPLNGAGGKLPPGVRYSLETQAGYLGRQQDVAQQQRGIDLNLGRQTVQEAQFAGGAPATRDLGLRGAGQALDRSRFGLREQDRWAGVLFDEFVSLAQEDKGSKLNKGSSVNTYALEQAIRAEDWSAVAALLGISRSKVDSAVKGKFANGGEVSVVPKGAGLAEEFCDGGKVTVKMPAKAKPSVVRAA